MALSEDCTPSPFGAPMLIVSVALVFFATVAVLLRIVASRKSRGQTWHYADTWLVITALVNTSCAAMSNELIIQGILLWLFDSDYLWMCRGWD